MPLTIGSNIASLQVQRQLGLASNQITSSYQRLSSGQRINQASDDAAGVAISEALKSSVRINTQAVKNLNDGISVLNIAKSALDSLSQITIRQMELAEQSANGTYTNMQRSALHEEAKLLTDEYNRIIKTTEFNGLKLLDGSFRNVAFQAGIGQHAIISVSIGVELLDNAVPDESGNDLVGTGEFTVTSSFTGGSLGVGLATGDFNGDGNLDAATTNNGPVRFWWGNGDGTFAPGNSLSKPGINFSHLGSGDFNEDGRVDLVFASLQGELNIALNQGGGAFQPPVTIPVYLPGNTKPLVNDFDGDGNLDILAGGNGRAQILYGDGGGAFTSSTVLTWGSNIVVPAVGDINNDGEQDIILTDIEWGGGAAIFTKVGATSYQLSGTISELGNRYTSVLADFNKDGNLDRVSIRDQESNGLAGISFGNGTTIPSPSSSINLTNVPGGPNRELLAHDFNGDGNIDILAASRPPPYDAGYLFLSTSNGDGTFKSPITVGPSSNLDYGLELGDINGDKVLDIITSVGAMIAMSMPNPNIKSSTVGYLNLKSQNNGREALIIASERLSRVSKEVSIIGAIESRLNVAVSNLQTSIIRETDARGRILDADIAQESSELIRRGIIQQAASAVLSQANMQSEIALGLI